MIDKLSVQFLMLCTKSVRDLTGHSAENIAAVREVKEWGWQCGFCE